MTGTGYKGVGNPSRTAPQAVGLGNSGSKNSAFKGRFAKHAAKGQKAVMQSGKSGMQPMTSAMPID